MSLITQGFGSDELYDAPNPQDGQYLFDQPENKPAPPDIEFLFYPPEKEPVPPENVTFG